MKVKISALLLLLVLCVTQARATTELPQFSWKSFDGWTYNSPWATVTGANIAQGNIVLYKPEKLGLHLYLLSPQFDCTGIDSIALTVAWRMDHWDNTDFDLEKTALTVAMLDESGESIDSVTVAPTLLQTRDTLRCTLAVPQGITVGQLRFASWQADYVSHAAVTRVDMTAVTVSQGSSVVGDVNGDGACDINDVTALIDYLLGSSLTVDEDHADVNRDGVADINDVTSLIDMLLQG